MTGRRVRLAAWPNDAGNPYQDLLYGALAPLGVDRVAGLEINDQCLRDLAPALDVIHLHWPEYAWRVGGSSLASQGRLIVGLYRFLALAHQLGIAVWWTAHNVTPHEGPPAVNWAGYFAVARKADLVIAHTARAAAHMRRRYGVRHTVVVPHGNFRGAYPPPRARSVTCAEFGLSPDTPIVVCPGTVRAYKGLSTAIDAAIALNSAVQLVVAGDPKPDVDTGGIQASGRGKPWLHFHWHRLSNQQFSDLVAASEAVLLPYRRVTTSGVLLAAWTLGRGVIASDVPYFADELSQFPDAGMLSKADDPDSLAQTIVSYLARPAAARESAALAAAGSREWPRSVEGLAPYIHAIRDRGRPLP